MGEPTPPPLVAEVNVVVHPVDVDRHHKIPAGWRWAVTVGGRPPADLEYCVQAGHDPERMAAEAISELVGIACVQTLRKLGSPARYSFQRLDYDPLPDDAGNHPIARFD
jgi:hypothetical protein